MKTMESNSSRHYTILKEYGIDDAANYETIQGILSIHFKHLILSLTRAEALDDLIYMFNNYDIFNDANMLELIGTMMITYAKTKSINISDQAGSKVRDNSDHGVAKYYVAYLSKDGKDYYWDWNRQHQSEIELLMEGNIKEIMYSEFCSNFKSSLERNKILARFTKKI